MQSRADPLDFYSHLRPVAPLLLCFVENMYLVGEYANDNFPKWCYNKALVARSMRRSQVISPSSCYWLPTLYFPEKPPHLRSRAILGSHGLELTRPVCVFFPSSRRPLSPRITVVKMTNFLFAIPLRPPPKKLSSRLPLV